MSEHIGVEQDFVPLHKRARDWFANSLSVTEAKKEEIYLQVSRSATLNDVSYWTQVLFSAGIATLGLALNSPAVIIGAMLISPLMGPILASGLALATGDFVLATRGAANLLLSCLLAIFFAVILVALLPFKEITSEIAARTQPNTLDLVIALFSGAVGSIAVCKEVKGVVTSIPGVAIAVALMPPLCVVGHGVGLALSLNWDDGARIARGGGLLFMTNLVAIIFTAMVVFVALHMDTEKVKEKVLEWQRQDKESHWVRQLIGRLPIVEKLKVAGSLTGRFVAIGFTILLILVPLTQAFLHLKSEIAKKQRENRVRAAAVQLWEENFSRLPNGDPRGYLGQLSLVDREDKLALLLRVFTIKPYSTQEKAEYTRLVAARIDRPVQSVAVRLIEIPTVSSDLLAKAREDSQKVGVPEESDRTEEILSFAQLQTQYAQLMETTLGDLRLPAPALFLDYAVTTSNNDPPVVKLSYLSERDIEPDAIRLITDDILRRLQNPEARVVFERVEVSLPQLQFARNQTQIGERVAELLDGIGQQLKRFHSLKVEISAGAERGEPEGIAEERAKSVANYLSEKWQAAPEQIKLDATPIERREAVLKLSALNSTEQKSSE